MAGSCRRWYVAGISLVWLASAGCLQTPVYLAEVNYVPSVEAKCPGAEVHVFRVDLTLSMDIQEKTSSVLRETTEHHELSRIQPSADGATPLQVGLTMLHGWRYV